MSLTHSLTHTLSSLCISDAHPSHSQSTPHNHLSTRLPLPLLFLLVAGWWLFHCYRCFIPPWESQNVCLHYQICHTFWLGILQEIQCIEPIPGQVSKTHKTRTVLENRVEWGLDRLPWKNSNEESRSVREHDYWLSLSAKFKMSGTEPSLPHVASWPAQRQF
jgi:hypothetical protein